ncbi:MAG: DNA replication/repair protein RecF [Candidatus Thermofonsia Clade 1 bacterium]|jgi:DNA replication and repair protein RecF|uniref:DNA replication and repair protein RecF n=1 Tax=Candidatus Thermofonsia Clade 1 bacterium TaxID=2364210 RepID=A0A2M8PXQ0_9CHLR|nr:MAG: DNA replication/repair protein RecF [Candidatus Thermofonsia Clade 1 bacterium]
MRLLHLSLTNFRSYARLELPMPEGMVLLCGANAQGKTSLLEAIYYLATGRSPWTTSDRQLLNWRAESEILPFIRISAELCSRHSDLTRLDITIYKENENGAFRKEIRVNGARKRVLDLMGILNVVLFLPQDLALIEGAPVDRRRYLNIALAQTDPRYAAALQTFDKALTQRNALLRQIAEQRAKPRELAYWDEQFVESGSVLIAGRQRLLRDLELLAADIHRQLTDDTERLTLHYLPGFTPTARNDGQLAFNVPGLDLHHLLAPNEIAPQLRKALAQNQREEIARGITLIGPQRDELRFLVNGRDLGLYGSRGQARTAVLALKLAEQAWMRQVTQDEPVLLLDEFIAELDAQRRAFLLERIQTASQALLTTTEPEMFTPAFLQKAAIWQVRSGQILPTP